MEAVRVLKKTIKMIQLAADETGPLPLEFKSIQEHLDYAKRVVDDAAQAEVTT